MATIVGWTACNRREAWSTKEVEARRSKGAATAQARSTRSGTARAATAAATDGRPRSQPTTTTTTSSRAHSAAKVRSRRVQAKGDVLPRTERPSGPAVTTTAVRRPTRGNHSDATTAAVPTAPPIRLAAVDRHHRVANRVTDPAR